MEKYRCKLCFKKFSNGRALGGHMRSHTMNLPLPPKPDPPLQRGCDTVSSVELSHDFSYSSSSDSETRGDDDDKPTGSSSLVTLQDRESETESLMKNPTRRRSKRTSSLSNVNHQHYYYYNNYNDSHVEDEHYHHHHHQHNHQPNELAGGNSQNNNSNKNNRPISVSPVSSMSEVTSDEDLAYCLMMMSRDKWSTTNSSSESKYKSIYNSSTLSSKVNKKKFKCETCNKVFRSYQALGGHRASHKKNQNNGNFDFHLSNNFISEVQNKKEKENEDEEQQQTKKKIHECPICLRVFSSGQALGGHKRSHVLISGDDYGNIGTNQDYSASLSNVNYDEESPKKMKMKMINESLIDLNLPAPVDYGDDNEEEISQIDDVHL